MENNKADKNFSQQPKKSEMPSKTATSNRPEIDLPLRGGRADSDLASKGSPKRDDKMESDKKSVR